MFLALFTFIGALASSALAAGFYGNQSDIHWKTAGSEHFQFIYPGEYSEQAATASAYAEAVYDSVVSRYNMKMPGRVNITLNNALYSNGSAIPSENSMNLWLTNWDFKIRSSHGWLSDVVTHEFSHLVSIESGSKVPPSIFGVQVSYTDYYNERTTSNYAGLFPFTLQPLWLAEGTAQYESSRMGFDGWDTHRDMLLRTAALNDGLLSLEYMHDFSDNSLYAELGPYTQGFALVRYISKHYGEDAIPKIWKELSKVHRVTLDAAIKNVLGISEKELYEAWKKEITEEYTAQKDSLGTLIEGIKITTDAFWQDFPVVAGKNIYGVSNFGGLWFDGGIFKMPKTLDSLTDEKSEEDGIIIEGFEGTVDITEYAKHGFKTKKPWFDKGIDVFEDPERGPILAYVNYQNRDKAGHAHFDIAVADTNKNQISVTYLTDAVYPNIDKQGDYIYFARRDQFSTRFILSKVPFPKDFKEYVSEDPIDVFVPDAKYKYYNIYSPKASPDGKKILFGFFDDVHRGLAVINSNGSGLTILSDTTSQVDERDGNWISDNKIVFASNKNGIFNLYERNLDNDREKPLTNVVGGAFTPVVAEDTLFFTAYDADGFSLYKMGISNAEPEAPKDSVIQVPDTLWTVCPEIPATDTASDIIAAVPDSTVASTDSIIAASDSTAVSSDSTMAAAPDSANVVPTVADSAATVAEENPVIADSCKPQMVIAYRDSIIPAAPMAPPPALHGKLLPKEHKPLELTSREFAGVERDYKPIPTVPLFVPMLSLNENAPDLTVFGEGQLKVKAGLAAIISDPLKKNTIQIGLLLELGNGFDYINMSGLNPKQEKEFFATWENHSTPVDLALSYTYANYTSKDTVRYDDVQANDGDSLGINHYAIPMQAIAAGAGYSIFKSNDSLQIGLGYDWADFNLYEDNFSWTYQKRISAMAAFSLYGNHEEEGGSGINGQGNGLTLYYQYSNSDLYRPGTFSESFHVTASGVIEPDYRNYSINEVGINLYGSVQSPLTGAQLAAGGRISGIINWTSKEDTLDSYYYSPILLEGYPYLRSSENYTRAGTRTAVAEVHYLFPIYDDWRKNFWIFTTRDFYFDVFAQTGAAWNSKWLDSDKWKDHDFWDRSLGLSFRMSNKIFYSIPLDISFTLARGLSRIAEEDVPGGRKLNPIDLPLIPSSIAPTRINFTIGMGFINSWQ